MSFVDILVRQNTVCDKTVLFIVDSMTVGFPAKSRHFYGQPPTWRTKVLHFRRTVLRCVVFQDYGSHLLDCCVEWIKEAYRTISLTVFVAIISYIV